MKTKDAQMVKDILGLFHLSFFTRYKIQTDEANFYTVSFFFNHSYEITITIASINFN